MSTLIPTAPAANKSTEQHQEPSEQDCFNHLLYKGLRLTSAQVQDLNGWMDHRGIPNVHEVIAQNFRKPHALVDTDNVLQAQLDSTRPISYRSYFDLLKDSAVHLDQATKRGNKI